MISYFVFAFYMRRLTSYKGLRSSTQVYTTMYRNRDNYLKRFIESSLVFVTGDIIYFHFGNWLIDDVIVIGWTDSD